VRAIKGATSFSSQEKEMIVLFDFGLAREIHDEVKVTDHTWKLTGETGSLRYMAPEVAANKPYGECHDEIHLVFFIYYWNS